MADSNDRPRLWPLLVLFGALWLAATATSDGFLEDDAWTHYFYSRFSLAKPAFLLDVWGRPICTGIYAIAAPWAGMFGCRAVSLLLVATALLFTVRTARALRIDERLSAIFLLGQPMLFLHSVSVMTELPFAVLLIAAFLAYVRRRWWAMTVLVSLLPLARPEGFGFFFVALAALVIHRKFWPLLIIFLPLIFWSWLGWWMWGAPPDHSPWLWLRDHWPYSANSSYGHGSIFQFVALMPVLVGFSLPAVLTGLCFALRRRDRRSAAKTSSIAAASPQHAEQLSPTNLDAPSEEAPVERIGLLLVGAIPLALLVVHSVLWWAGKMASYGEIRYLLIASPFWAMLGAIGWERSKYRPSPIAIAVCGLLLVFAFKVTILRRSPEAAVARDVTAWYSHDLQLAQHRPRMIASHPAVYAYLNISPADVVHYGGWSPAVLEHPADDAIVIWDPKCGPFNADKRLVADVDGLKSLGWRTIEVFNGGWVAMVKDDERPLKKR